MAVLASIRCTRQTMRLTTGTQDFTVSGLGANTNIKGAIILISEGVTDDTVRDHARWSVGFTDGTRHRSIGVMSADNVADSVCKTAGSSGYLGRLVNTAGTANVAQAEFSAFITDGIRLNFSAVDGLAHQVIVILLAGTGMTVRVDEFSMNGAANSTADITAFGTRPTFVLFLGGCAAFNTIGADAFGANSSFSFGMTVDDGGVGVPSQRIAGYQHRDNRATSTPSMRTASDHVYNLFRDTAATPFINLQQVSIDSMLSTGFRAKNVLGSTPTLAIAYMAVKVSTYTASLIDIDSPSGIGFTTTISPGYHPGFFLGLSFEANGFGDYADTAGGEIGIGTADRNAQAAQAQFEQDNAATMNNGAVSGARAITGLTDGGAASTKAQATAAFNATSVIFTFAGHFAPSKRHMGLFVQADDVNLAAPLNTLALETKAPTIRARLTAPLDVLVIERLVPTVKSRVNAPLNTLALQAFAPTLRERLTAPLANLVMQVLAPSVRARVSTPLGELVFAPIAPTIAGRVNAPLGTLALVPQAPSLRVTLTTALGELVLEPLTPAAVIRIPSPLGELVLEAFAPSISTRLDMAMGTLAIADLAPRAVPRVEAPLAEMVFAPFAPNLAARLQMPLATLALFGPSPQLANNVRIEVPLGELVLFGQPVAFHAVILTNQKRIFDELIQRVLDAQFPLITYNNASGDLEVIEGTHQKPMSRVANEVRSAYTGHPKVQRRRDFQERAGWSWQLILQFHREVSLELFERALMDQPIFLKEDYGNELESVRLRMVDTVYDHPTEQQPSNGTKATYQFVAEVGPR